MLKNGTPAPEFTLADHEGNTVSLKDLKGHPVVLFFFRGKFCPTSKRYLIEWQEFSRKVHNLGAQLVAISSDTLENHAWMVERYDLRFPLLSDSDLKISEQYGIYLDTHDGTPYGEPALILLDKNGDIAYSQISSGPKGLAGPGEIAPILIYMFVHEGKY